MTKTSTGFMLLMGLLICWRAPAAAAPEQATRRGSVATADIVARIEKRYAGSGFSARFDQTSTLKEMAITDTAAGKIYVQHPGRMRWEYQTPERQIFITDSSTLWIYRPEDNQVMMGEAPNYFGSGKGASFLSNMNQLRENFRIERDQADTEQYHVLTLYPKSQKIDLSVIYLSISKQTFDVIEIVSLNSLGDETRIVLSDFLFNQGFADTFFKFNIPAGADVLRLDQ